MHNSHIVAGRIIEIQADRVLAQQGDTISSYHPRYYTLPEAELRAPAECDLNEESVIEIGSKGGARPLRRGWNVRIPWLSPQKKSANRI
jgi:hypothetical protein